MGNPIQEKMKKVPNAVIELMSIYQQMLDLHSDKFPDRNIPLLKESFQKSLHSSVETKLLPFYLNELKEDHPDSFFASPDKCLYETAKWRRWVSWNGCDYQKG